MRLYTSANFLKYVDGCFYTSGRFHRATRTDNYIVDLPNRPLLECIQAGINPDRRSQGFPPIALERTGVTGLQHIIGTVSMARVRSGHGHLGLLHPVERSAVARLGGKRFDDGEGEAVFGRVVAGMPVVQHIRRRPTNGQSLSPPVTFVSAKRETP
jgi:peptidyl-prolyl cis-trans isomerase A (cyclophilin A)